MTQSELPELTQELRKALKEIFHNIDYGSHSFDDLFRECLKIADTQGLLSKEEKYTFWQDLFYKDCEKRRHTYKYVGSMTYNAVYECDKFTYSVCHYPNNYALFIKHKDIPLDQSDPTTYIKKIDYQTYDQALWGSKIDIQDWIDELPRLNQK